MFIYRKVSPTQRSRLLNIFDQLRKDTGLTSKQLFFLRHNKDFTQIIVLVIISQQGSVCRFSVFFARMSVTKLKALLVFPTNKGWVLLVTPILLWGMKHITHMAMSMSADTRAVSNLSLAWALMANLCGEKFADMNIFQKISKVSLLVDPISSTCPIPGLSDEIRFPDFSPIP